MLVAAEGRMIQRIIVLGGGSAGFLAAISLRTRLPHTPVVVIRSKDIGVIGVGEGTTVAVPNFLHGFLRVDPMEFHRSVRPTYKLGIKFLWGPRPFFNYTFAPQFDMRYQALPRPTGFYCDEDDAAVGDASINSALMSRDKAFVRLPDGSPGIRNDVAYHIENADLVRFLEQQAAKVGAEVVDDTVAGVEQDERGVTALRCGATGVQRADFFVDCSGFYSVLLGKTLAEPFVPFKSSLFCDRAVVGGWKRGDDEPIKSYTTAETMDAGWCWQIEHEHRVNRGYVYSSPFISDADAETEFRKKNPKVDATRIVKFISGRYERGWVKNVVAIGNSGGFVEPLESTSLAAICKECHALAGSLEDRELRPGATVAAAYNKHYRQTWDDIRRFLAIHYKFNTRFDTPFWRAARADTDVAGAEEFVEFYEENGPTAAWKDVLVHGEDVFGFEGYLAMMVGQRVPYRHVPRIDPSERETFAQVRAHQARQAASGLTVAEALRVIHDSPGWKVRPGFYHYP